MSQDQKQLVTAKVSRTFKLPGYVLDSDILSHIDTTCKKSVSSEADGESDQTRLVCWVRMANNNMLKFDSTESLATYVESDRITIKSISLQYISSRQAGISLDFLQNGRIELSAYSNEIDFQFNIDRLIREIERCDQDYSWAVRTLVLKPYARSILFGLLLGISVFLLLHIAYYLYALQVGVNIDQSLIPSGNTYYQEIESAIRSSDISRKMNALLLGQLRGFTNVRDVLAAEEHTIVLALIATVLGAVLIIALRLIMNLYPKSFFAFSEQSKKLEDLKRKREIWGVTIIIGFAVNIIAGIAISVLSFK